MPRKRHELPPGHRSIELKRTHRGQQHSHWLGHHEPSGRFLAIRSDSDGELYPIDKAELLPPGAWLLLEAVFAAARAAEQPVEEVIRFINDRIQGNREFPLLSLFRGLDRSLSCQAARRPPLRGPNGLPRACCWLSSTG